MCNAIRLYIAFLSVSLKAQMQYKVSFLMQSVGQFAITFIDFAGIWILFQRFDNIRGWRLPEVALLYGTITCAFSIAEAASYGFDFFSETVRKGDFDRLLLRPRSTALQLAGQELALRRVGKLFQALVVLLWATTTLDLNWSMVKIMLLLLSIFGGICVFYGLFILQATLSFWTIESLEIINIVTYGGTETAQYPISVYQPWFRRFFIFVVPVGAINYFPTLAILEKQDPLGLPVFFQYVSPFFGFVFLIFTFLIWGFGEKHYRSTGS